MFLLMAELALAFFDLSNLKEISLWSFIAYDNNVIYLLLLHFLLEILCVFLFENKYIACSF